MLLLTARGDEADKVAGLDLGADDYVAKPFGKRELIARLRALLRRSPRLVELRDEPMRFSLGPIAIDLAGHEAVRDGEVTTLSPTEVGILRTLLRRAGEVVRRDELLDEVWGSHGNVGPRTVDTHLLNLRGKVEVDPKAPRYLQTVHRAGYKLMLDESP